MRRPDNRRMGGRNPERDRPYLSEETSLTELARGYPGWILETFCRDCLRMAYLKPDAIVRQYGEMTVGELSRRLRCRGCGGRGMALQPRYGWERR